MALINRFSRLFRADLHAVLDRIEEPVTLLKQAVREMEDDVTQDERNLKILQHELGQIPVLEEELENSLKELQLEISLCLDSDNESLARSVIKRKLAGQQRARRLRQQADEIKREVATLTSRLANNRSRLSAMQQKLEILEEDSSRSHAATEMRDMDITITEDDIEVALLKEKQARASS
ncbi:MAG: PspA/IM30 family protein [Thioalkalispiraceae bacterium]|jgi:phage shock protein A